MWHEKTIKIIPAVLFLFCLLEVFEMVLIIDGMNKTEKLETEVKNNLKMLESITKLLDDHLEGMGRLKEIKIK
ncbi:hypothetical protein HpHNI24_14770 [Helicobacter pylori]